ncbi:glycosyltransferase family 2 protein [uncultured Flavobacterium sp.]|uniref:glycosyltransferase family 2 protein n=1 Tax=uncultured Flavobacterium sp. TaxID=165435 RepID=UPI0030EED756|tara:strand:- start:17743 stop:18669 length:927 start_codon:yes stop_codon:yes gene_type:complete
MNCKVSVILPIYNGEKTLARTLESLIHQTFNDFELIACIDGTNDNSFKILEENKLKFKKVVILKNEINLGLGPTMNRLTANAVGEYIAVAEQDDFYYPERLDLQVRLLDSKPNIGLVSGIADFWDGNEVINRFPGILVNANQYPLGQEMFLFNYKYQMKVVNTCMMFRKSVHIDNGLYFTKHYPNIPIDWAYILRFCLVSDIFGIHKSLVLLDRRNQRNSVTSNKKNHFSGARELIRSFKYEYPNVITKKDYKFAMTTQHIIELHQYSKYKMPFYFINYYFKNTSDIRWSSFISKKIKGFLKPKTQKS